MEARWCCVPPLRTANLTHPPSRTRRTIRPHSKGPFVLPNLACIGGAVAGQRCCGCVWVRVCPSGGGGQCGVLVLEGSAVLVSRQRGGVQYDTCRATPGNRGVSQSAGPL